MTPTATLTLQEIIRKNNDGDVDSTAQKVLDDTLPVEYHDLFRALVRDEVRRRFRLETLIVERRSHPTSVHPASKPPTLGGSATATQPLLRAELLAEEFYNGERRVSWANATVADHQGRIDFQLELRNGLDADIALHQEAIDLIVANGVQTLGDLA